MIWQVALLATGVAIAGALVATLITVVRERNAAAERAAEAEAEADALRARIDALERSIAAVPRPVTTDTEFVITRMGEEPAEAERLPAPVRLTAPAFADAVLRETVVHTVALAAGVRRALAPEVRNRVRFEMKREIKRSRKARKIEMREALREYRARHRADVVPDSGRRGRDVA